MQSVDACGVRRKPFENGRADCVTPDKDPEILDQRATPGVVHEQRTAGRERRVEDGAGRTRVQWDTAIQIEGEVSKTGDWSLSISRSRRNYFRLPT